MNELVGRKPSVGKIIVFSIIGLIAGALHPFILIYQMMLPMSIPCLNTIVAVLLYAGGGFVPLIVQAAATVVMSLLSMGPKLLLASLPMWMLPTAIVVAGMHQKAPFFRQMRNGVISALGGAMLSVVLAALFYGSTMVADLMAQLQTVFEAMMPEIWKIYEPMLEAQEAAITYEEFASMFYSVLKLMQQYYEQYLPANLLEGAAISAVITVLWGNWIHARKGLATPQSFVGLCDWYLPSNMTFGVLMTLAAGFVLKNLSINGAEIAWNAVSQLAVLTFAVQALAANDRRMKATGSSRGRRMLFGVLIGVLFIILKVGLFGLNVVGLLAVLGAVSALFGRRGALRPWIDKMKGNADQNKD